MNYSVVIVAAGKGSRTNLEYNKVFYEIAGKPLIDKTLSLFVEDAACEAIIVVVSAAEKARFETVIQSDKVLYAIGGATRQESVYNGLKLVKSSHVMIHDGARPFLQVAQLEALKQALQNNDACLLVVPVVDTIKIVADGYVEQTPMRSHCYCAQTPQGFKTEVLVKCYEQARVHEFVASDDAQLVEVFSDVKVKAVIGEYSNKKITIQADLL